MATSSLFSEIRTLLDDGRDDAAVARSADERRAVERLMASPHAAPVYGFTTLLGHLDDASAAVSDQSALLRAHLVGPVASFPPSWGRLLASVKLTQLAHGGSGIHPDLHEQLRVTAADAGEDAWEGNWTTSYGSGDVVPGAWFAEGLRRRGRADLDHAGDLIALINGHFVSTSAGLVVADGFLALVGESLEAVQDAASRAGAAAVQHPVTLRDVGPLETVVRTSTTALLTALRDRMAGPSGNPLFDVRDGEAVAISQSSFLDFTLTGALTQALQACAQTGAYLKAVIGAATAADPHDASARVQPTKIAEALLREIGGFAVPTHFSLSESGSVEDVADLSLLTARLLAGALQRLDALLDLTASVTGIPRARRESDLADIAGDDLLPHLVL